MVPLDLRHGFPKTEQGMIARARRTRQAIEANILGRPGAEHHRRRGPDPADRQPCSLLRGDGVGAKAGPVFQVNEFKGWAVVDGRAEDAGKLGAAQTQMGIYRYLLSDLIWAPSLRHCIEDR